MKKFYVAAAFLALGLGSNAQTNLLMEDFQNSPNTYIDQAFPSQTAGDTSWYNFDEDGLPTQAPVARPGDWFWALAFANADFLTGTGDSNFVYASDSWTYDPSPVLNHLVTPSVTIPSTSTSAVLTWKTATYQTPLYLDGFTVKISTTTNDITAPGVFTYKYAGAEYTGGPAAGDSANFNAYTFGTNAPVTAGCPTCTTPWIHGWDGSTIQAAELEDNSDSARWNGILTTHTLDLSAYIGQSIYIDFVHQTIDDNLMSIDDISIDVVTGINPINAISKVTTYPNPTVDYVTIEYTSTNASPAAILKVTDMNGRIISTQSLGMMNSGLNKVQIDATGFANGIYNVDIKTDLGVAKTSFMKK